MMTKKQALKKLKSERLLYTSMLEPLDVSFEQFLRIAQFTEDRTQNAYDNLINREESKLKQLTIQKLRGQYDKRKK
tara:strand:+ start:2429 stop:2656 length:228 start_codon:yes stop_codon:yes gene_type:complete